MSGNTANAWLVFVGLADIGEAINGHIPEKERKLGRQLSSSQLGASLSMSPRGSLLSPAKLLTALTVLLLLLLFLLIG